MVGNVKDCNKKSQRHIVYPDIPSARRPVPHSDLLPVSIFTSLPDLPEVPLPVVSPLPMEVQQANSDEYDIVDTRSDEDPKDPNFDITTRPTTFRQEELSDLIRNLELSKESVLASRLNEKKLLSKGTRVTFYRTREEK